MVNHLIEGLEPRRLLTAVLFSSIPNTVFTQDSGSEVANLNGVFADTNGQSDLTFSANSSNPAVVSASINGSALTLTPANGASGYAVIKMTAADPLGNRVSNAFRVLITAAAGRSLDVTLNPQHPSVNFIQSNHASATITLKGPGSATLHFGGDGLKLAGKNLNGANQELESITVTGTTGGSKLLIDGRRANGQGAVIGDISTDGPLALLQEKNTVELGDVTIAKAVPQLQIDVAQAGMISVGSTAIAIKGKQFVDENFSSSARILSLKMLQWVDSDNVPETFSATTIGRLSIPGSFAPGLQLSGGGKGPTLGPTRVGGTIGGQWNIHGGTASLKVGSTASSWNATFDSLPALTVVGQLSGSMTVPSLKSVKAGSVFIATLNFSTAGKTDLPLLKAGTVDVLTIDSAGSIGTISAKAIANSTIFAGGVSVPSGDVLPASPSDFASNAVIGAIVLHPSGKLTGLAGSLIAAERLGSLSLGTIQTNNMGFKFGVAGSSIGKLVGIIKGNRQPINLKNVHDPATLVAQIAAQKLQLGDMIIRIV